MKRILALISCIGILVSLAGCKKNTADPIATTIPLNAPPAEVEFSKTEEEMFTDRDKKTDYNENQCIKIALNGTTATAGDNSVQISGSTITITKESTYLVTGTLNDGSLVVNAPDTAKLQIIFKNASITSSTSAALHIQQADKVFLTLADGSSNTLSNGGSFSDETIDGALFSRDDLTINGSGSLTVTSPAGHGIVCKDDLVLTGGNYTVTSASHGLDANDSIRICDSTLTVEAGKDGLHAENTDDATLGFIYTANITLNVKAEGDGVSAGATMQLESGIYDIFAGGGYENGDKASSDGYGGFPGGPPGGGGYRPGRPGGYTTTAQSTTEESTSMKGFKAGAGLLISDGTYTVDTADDAFHSNDSLTVNGGTFTVASGDDAFHAETTLTITACTMNVTQCYEGLEAEQISVMGGSLDLNCNDDGLNAAGGTDSSGGGGRDQQFGRPGGGMFGGSNPNALISVSGGALTIRAGGDGLDSNGNLTISGGSVTVYNPKSGDTSVLDADQKPVITGGTYLGLGISTGMLETFSPTDSTQGFLVCNLGKQAANVKITVTDSTGKVVLDTTTQYQTVLLMFSSSEIVKNATYTVTAGTYTTTVTAS